MVDDDAISVKCHNRVMYAAYVVVSNPSPGRGLLGTSLRA